MLHHAMATSTHPTTSIQRDNNVATAAHHPMRTLWMKKKSRWTSSWTKGDQLGSVGVLNVLRISSWSFLCFSRTVYRNTAVKVAVPYRPSLQKTLYGTGMAKTYPFWTVNLTAVTVIRYGAQPYPFRHLLVLHTYGGDVRFGTLSQTRFTVAGVVWCYIGMWLWVATYKGGRPCIYAVKH